MTNARGVHIKKESSLLAATGRRGDQGSIRPPRAPLLIFLRRIPGPKKILHSYIYISAAV